MRKISVFLLASLFVAAGCEGCRFPFSTTSTATIRLALHATNSTCNDSGGPENKDNGTPDDASDDYTVRWEQAVDAEDTDETPDCRLGSTWSGSLLNMAAVRDGVDEAISEAGLDPATVQVELTSLGVEVDEVKLIDDVSGSDDPDVTGETLGLVQRYSGNVVPSGNDLTLITVTTDGGTIQAPVTTVSDTTELTALANAALASNSNVAGTGDAEVVVDFDDQTAFATFAALTNPTLLVTMTIVVNGDAIVGGTPPSEE